jgi:hypothetical protein
MSDVRDMFLVTQRKTLEEVEPIWLLRLLLRKYFEWRGFACRSHTCNNEDGRHGEGKQCDGKCYASIEYRGVTDDEAAARFASSCQGGEYKPVPFNAFLPEETVSYIPGDSPLSEASPWYRRGTMLPFVAVAREDLDALGVKIEQTVDCAKGKCVSKAS